MPKFYLRSYTTKIPKVGTFVNLIVPFFLTLVVTVLITIVINKMENYKFDTWLLFIFSISSALALFYIILFCQDRFLHSIFSGTFSSYISSLREAHPVTQKFANELLTNYLQTKEFKKQIITIYSSQNVYNLKGIMQSLQSDNGLELDDDLYISLLKNATYYYPTIFLAIWDTNIYPIGIHQYGAYFRVLDKCSHLMKEKMRFFVFEDEANFLKQTSVEEWQVLLNYHFNKWHFNRIHYCYRTQMDDLLKGRTIAIRGTTDYVLFGMKKWILPEMTWLIGQDSQVVNNMRKTYLVQDEIRLRHTRDFMNELKTFCEDTNRNQYINNKK